MSEKNISKLENKMSGECEKCGEHAVDCKCPMIMERKWISKEEAKEMWPDCHDPNRCNEDALIKSLIKASPSTFDSSIQDSNPTILSLQDILRMEDRYPELK